MTLPKPWRCGGAARAPAAAATVALLALMSRAPLAAAAQEVSLDFEGLQPERHSMVEFPYRFRVSNPGEPQQGGTPVGHAPQRRSNAPTSSVHTRRQRATLTHAHAHAC